jgi:transposase
MTMNEVTLPNNRKAYAYIGVDTAKKFEGIRNIGLSEDPRKPMSDEEFDFKTKISGMFVMISSLELKTSEVLPFYYSRQTIEQIFDTSKNYARLLPLGVHSREAFNGHLLLSFMTTITYLKFQKIFLNHKYNTIDFITELEGLTCGVYDDHLHVYEPTARQKKILKILNIEIPTILPLKN